MSQPKPSCPDWAESFGFDEYGAYADMVFVVAFDRRQRFRWCPPGRFAMITETKLAPTRRPGLGEHVQPLPPVKDILFETGFWLADSPCTDHSNLRRLPLAGLTLRRAEELAKAKGCLIPTCAQLAYAACSFQDETNYWAEERLWNRANTNGIIQPNYTSKPNKYGFYDLRGNVWEWGVVSREVNDAMLCGGSCMIDISSYGFQRKPTSMVSPREPIGVRLLAPP